MQQALVIDHVSKHFLRDLEATKEQTERAVERLRRLFRRQETETVTVVEDITLSVRRGEIFGILGENGSGKSTLIRMISTLLLPDEGSIRLFGHDVVAEPRSAQRMINRVSVEASFFKHLSALENLSYTARLYGLPVSEAERRIGRILAALRFDVARLNEPMEDFSRGMQQKVAIARALLTTPVMLLLDEPTTGLDPRSRRDVQSFIQEVRKEHDTTILLTTHDMQEAEALCDRLCIMQHGRILAQGTLSELKGRYTASGDGSLEEVFLSLTGSSLNGEDDVG